MDFEKWKEESDMASQFVEAVREGESRGEQIGILSVAKNMLRGGKLSIEDIIKYTGLSREQIVELQSNSNENPPSRISL